MDRAGCRRGISSTGKVSLVHVARDGSWLWQGESLAQYLAISSVSVNKADGSCWLTGCCNYEGMLHVAQDGTELARLPWAGMTLAPNSSDGSYWVSNWPGGVVTHFDKDNNELWHGSYSSPCFPAVNPVDGSCWVGDMNDTEAWIVHLGPDGTELSRTPGFDLPWYMSVNVVDGSCWVCDGSWEHPQVAHLDANGNVLWSGRDFISPCSVSVNPTDGSCWVADEGGADPDTDLLAFNGKVVHLGLQYTLRVTATPPGTGP